MRHLPMLPGALALGATALLLALPVAAAVTNAPPVKANTKIRVDTAAVGLENPWGLQFLPDGRMLVTERPGRLRIIANDGKISAPITGVPEVYAHGQGGLLDVRLAPDFAQSSTLFLSYAEPRQVSKNGTSVARAKLVLDGDGGKLEELTVIFRQQPSIASGAHFGSRIVVGSDGALFVTLGERYSMRREAQNPSNDLGKVIHILADGTPAPDNPKLKGWAPEVWSIGHRNVQGAALHPVTGKLWTAEHGARGGDELNIVEKGKNYGWPVISYGRDYSGEKIGVGTAKEGMEQPVYYWDPSIATSGLAFYTGNLFPEWNGNAFVGGLAGAHLERLVLDGDAVVAKETLLDGRGDRIRDIRQGPDGALYVLIDDKHGKILRLSPDR